MGSEALGKFFTLLYFPNGLPEAQVAPSWSDVPHFEHGITTVLLQRPETQNVCLDTAELTFQLLQSSSIRIGPIPIWLLSRQMYLTNFSTSLAICF